MLFTGKQKRFNSYGQIHAHSNSGLLSPHAAVSRLDGSISTVGGQAGNSSPHHLTDHICVKHKKVNF